MDGGTAQGLVDHTTMMKRRFDGLKHSTERTNCEIHWQEIAEVMSPRKIDFVGLRTPGEKKMNKVYDSTGIHANEMLAAGLHGMATNPASKWFSLRMVGKTLIDGMGQNVKVEDAPPVQKYLSHVEESMWQRIYQPGTNFTTALHEVYLDLGTFGTSILFVGQRDDNGLLFEARPLAECVIAENAEGRVDTVFRCTTYTVRQMMQMAKSDGWKLSDAVKSMYESEKYDEKVMVIHAVHPRNEREPGKKDKMNMPYMSCYFEHESGQLLEMGGFPEFPYLVPRWSKYAGEVYGRSPGMTALPDVKMLQAMMITIIKAAQKIVDPPMWLRDDGVVGQTRTIPGGINYWRGNPNDGVMLMPVSGQALPITQELMEELRNRIRTTFFTDVLQFQSNKDMTATEVVQRTAERMRLMGPLLGRLESELLGPLVERVFGILTRQKLLPDPPHEIQGQEFTVEYVSPIATAQKQQAANGIMQAFQVMAPFGPEIGAQIVGKELNAGKMFRWAWDLFNCDPDLLNDDEAMAAAAQDEQNMKGIAMAQPMADVVSKGAGAVRDIAQAQGSGGIDIPWLLAKFGQNVKGDPRANQELEALSNGTQPPPPA